MIFDVHESFVLLNGEIQKFFPISTLSEVGQMICLESGGGGVLAMFAYGGVRAMLLGLKFHLKAIFLRSKICNMNFPIWRGKKFQQLAFFLDSIL